MYNTLRADLELDGSRVLDLFAGSGAVGLEALSRGAAAAVFVESDRSAVAVLQQNVAAVGCSGAAVHRCTVQTYLAATGADEPFDLVFMDPPYALDAAAVNRLVGLLVQHGWLLDGGIVVVERSWRAPEPSWPDEIKAMRQRRYGEGCLWYGRRE